MSVTNTEYSDTHKPSLVPRPFLLPLLGLCTWERGYPQTVHLLCFTRLSTTSLVPSPRTHPSEKWSGEWRWISKVVKNNKIARSVIITWHFPYNSKICSSPIECPHFCCWKKFWTLLGCNVAKACTRPRNLTRFTRPFLLVRERVGSEDETNHQLHWKSLKCQPDYWYLYSRIMYGILWDSSVNMDKHEWTKWRD